MTSCVLMVKTRPQVDSVLAGAVFDCEVVGQPDRLCPNFKDWCSLWFELSGRPT